MRIENNIREVTKQVIKEAVFQNWEEWWKEDFETDIPIGKVEEFTDGTLTDDDIEINKLDFVYSIQDGFVAEVCDLIGLSTDTSKSKYHDEILEDLYEIVKEELWKMFDK